nr:ABC transporter permease [Cohnella algarum]
MTRYIARRLVSLIPVLLIVSIVVFLIIHMTPGDAATAILGDTASAEQLEAMRESLGLNAPLYEQFLNWLVNVLQGDFGESVFSGEPVLSLVLNRFGTTAGLALLATLLSLVIAVPLALLAVWKRNSWFESVFLSFSLFGISMPGFWMALLLILLFSVTLGWLPVAGYVPLAEGFGPWISHLLLPAVVLSVQQIGLIARMLRDSMLDVLGHDYVRTARAKGRRRRRCCSGIFSPMR